MPTIDIRLFNAVGFQLLWFACLLLPGPLALVLATMFVAGHFYWPLHRERFVRQVVVIAGVGATVDLLYAWAGMLRFPSVEQGISLNLLALWVGFAATIPLCFLWLRGRMVLAILLGGIFGPLSYLGGSKLGAVSFPMGDGFTLLVYAATWAVLMPLLVWVGQRPSLQFMPLKEVVDAR